MRRFSDRETLFRHMVDMDTILTPNNRLASALIQEASLAGISWFEKPRCLPFSTFIRNRFKALCHATPEVRHPLVLNPHQTRSLWGSILRESGLSGAESLIPQVEEAFWRAEHWGLQPESPDFDATTQTERFRVWHARFLEQMEALGAIHECMLLRYLLTCETDLMMPANLVWVCFDELTPLETAWTEAVAAQGCVHHQFERQANPMAGVCFEAPDERSEWDALVAWLHQQQRAGVARIGVVVPDLQTRSATMQRRLANHFDDHTFDISVAEPLSNHPLIGTALCLLTLDMTSLSREEALLLLHSPWLADAEREYDGRTRFAHHHPLLREYKVAGKMLVTAMESDAPMLASRLAEITPYPPEGTPALFRDAFIARLNIAGFPGDARMDSATWQYFQRFLTLFDDFQTLALTDPQLSARDALKAFTELVRQTVFQPRKNREAPIRMLGLLEASGCQFDSLWITGMTDQCLPAATRPSPFLPIHLQQALGMPHANPARELRLASKMLTRFRASAPVCVISFPRLSGDAPNLASPLIAELPRADYPPISLPEPRLETLDETWLVPLLPGEKPGGGSRLLANQATCPFRAFAAHRLAIRTPAAPSDGLDSAERGSALHAVLEHLWRVIASQAGLLALPDATLDTMICEAVDKALDNIPWRTHTFSPLSRKVERQRLHRVVRQALTLEKARAPFVVESVESRRTLVLGELELALRIDRMDTLEHGEKWVIDYKSRLPASTPWNEERPAEPQLLLYALLEEAVHGILFMAVQNGVCEVKGYTASPSALRGVTSPESPEDFEHARAQWKARLLQLAQEFQTGHCTPTPINATVCGRCEFPGLCRLTPA